MNSPEISLRKAASSDLQDILNIYNHYIKNTIITFDLEPISIETFRDQMLPVLDSFPFYIAHCKNEILGYAYLASWKKRKAYDFTVESSVYLKAGNEGKGIGKLLYKQLFNDAEKYGIHSVIAGISLPNESSVKFHEYFGFKYIGAFKEVGYKFDDWIDVGYWQLILNKQK